MRRLAILALGALSACATTPAIRVQTVEVLKPVITPCVKKAQIPAEPAAAGSLPPDARQAADLLGAKVLELRGYGRKLSALLSACAED